ncbi:hypothetical protein AVEN_204764-1 [Araneus ventricosus]|uniref:Uncharacterized protein n=1 Tax=Araneus ventricosus TaxID=182803 RepID=A0A4Y2FYX4_ARAVE|nr:hypothetical protein AVEN_204764-1 [Araneus ventricosus]
MRRLCTHRRISYHGLSSLWQTSKAYLVSSIASGNRFHVFVDCAMTSVIEDLISLIVVAVVDIKSIPGIFDCVWESFSCLRRLCNDVSHRGSYIADCRRCGRHQKHTWYLRLRPRIVFTSL